MDEPKNLGGRPQAIIDWDNVNRLLEIGCSGIEIGAMIGLHQNTIYDHCLKKFGIPFSEYSKQKYAKGDASIREAQYNNAISGNTSMQIWLGKNRLKQSESPEAEKISAEQLELFKQFMSQMTELSSDRNSADININEETKS